MWNSRAQFPVLCSQCSNSRAHSSSASRNSGFLLFYSVERPSHARSVMGNPETSLRIQQDDSPVAVEPLLQIVHRFLSDPLEQAAGFDAIRRPLREHHLHDSFAPPDGESRRAAIVAIAAQSDNKCAANHTQ